MTTQEITAVAADSEFAVARWKLVLRRLRRKPVVFVAGAVILLLIVASVVGPLISPYDVYWTEPNRALETPSAEHWLGIDPSGHDLFVLTMLGLQKSLLIGFLVSLGTVTIAAILGMLAGYFGGWLDKVVMQIITIMLVLPSLIILIVVSPVLAEKSWLWIIPVFVVFGWMLTARVVRSLTQSLQNVEFVQAARFMGVSHTKILLRHILPNISSWLIIEANLGVSAAILGETGLSILGFGINYPDISLGSVISSGSGYVTQYPHIFVPSAVMLVALILSVNVIGVGLGDALKAESGVKK